MPNPYRALLLSTMIALGAATAHAQTSGAQQATENMDFLKKEVSCILITDYAIRHLNLFAVQMDMLDNGNGDRRKVVLPLVAMAITMRLDADNRVAELLKQGMDQSYIDSKMAEITNVIYERYSQAYINSTDYDKATLFVRGMLSEQRECEVWFDKVFGKPKLDKPKSGNGGVDG